MTRLCIKQSRNISRIQGNLIERTLMVALFIIIGIVLLSDSGLASNGEEKGTFNVGLKIVDFEYEKPNGKKEIVTAAIWYPTEQAMHQYTYYQTERGKNVESKVALDASVSMKSKPYPLIIFAHGGYGSGYNSAFFMEYLAKHGYVAVAADYKDTAPPDYKKQIAFSRIKEGNVGKPMRVLAIVGRFMKDMNADRDFFISYLNEHRLDQTSFVIDKMVELNRNLGSIFYQSIQEDIIGICGHSLGGGTILGKIGAHPDKHFKDNRIKAALLFSSPVYPFEDNIGNIDIPMMIMAGDNDEPMNPSVPRRLCYDRANPAKFYLILKDATHFAFSNGASGSSSVPLYQAVETNAQTNAICRYGLAFFEKFLRKNLSVAQLLEKSDSAWVYYIKEEKKGEVFEWGKEPPPGQGGPGGIRQEFMGKRGKEGRLKRWQGKNSRGGWLKKWRNRAYEEQETWE